MVIEEIIDRENRVYLMLTGGSVPPLELAKQGSPKIPKELQVDLSAYENLDQCLAVALTHSALQLTHYRNLHLHTYPDVFPRDENSLSTYVLEPPAQDHLLSAWS